jgi:hypothetical protein
MTARLELLDSSVARMQRVVLRSHAVCWINWLLGLIAFGSIQGLQAGANLISELVLQLSEDR